MKTRVLVVDDDPNTIRSTRILFESEECEVQTAQSGPEAIARIQGGLNPDLVVLDLIMPGMDGLRVLTAIRGLSPSLRVVIVSCLRDPERVVQAIRLGADDYLAKPLDGAAVEGLLKRVRDNSVAPTLQPKLPDDTDTLPGGHCFVAGSRHTQDIRDRIAQIAEVNVPVLLLGESGVGKEVAALLIHKLSPRSSRTFMKVNCAAIPGELLESELFGYEAGAFTGATHAKPGKFELCNGGTILLDEIGEMSPGLQAKLLQVLQEQRFFRLGARSTISVDVRILAATNVDVENAIRQGKLRLDLYYRLNTFCVQIPPLRQRREDIPALFAQFLEQVAARYGREIREPSPEIMDACMHHSWPGNIRELHNFVKRYVVLGDDAALIRELNLAGTSARPFIAPKNDATSDLKGAMKELKRDAEAQMIAQALHNTGWNRRQAAIMLNISYKALVYKTRQYGLEVPTKQPQLVSLKDAEIKEAS